MNWREEWPGAFECRKDLVPSSTVITLPPVSPVQKKGNQIKMNEVREYGGIPRNPEGSVFLDFEFNPVLVQKETKSHFPA